jgi:CMP-N,N'-diacetyllegionaminic acid synthase
MINGLSVVAIIPARGGSKGLPGKNIREICGKPLIAWSIEQALESEFVDVVLVTSDCTEIVKVAEEYGAQVPFLRPAELAADDSSTVDVVVHAHDYYSKSLSMNFDYSVLVEPTAPIREKRDIDSMVQKLDSLKNQYDSIVSIGEVSEHPSIMKVCDGDDLKALFPDMEKGSRRQDYDAVFWPYGGLFVNKTDIMIREKSLYSKRLTFHKLKRYQCCEIDDLQDFVHTEALMRHEWKII